MKFSTSVLILLPALASAFAPSKPRVSLCTTSLSAVPSEEDLEKTRAVIAKFADGSTEADDEPAAKAEEEMLEEDE